METEPIFDKDVQKGTVYYERTGTAFKMAAHIREENGKLSSKVYTYSNGVFRLYEPGVDQVTTVNKIRKFESYLMLGSAASGKELEEKWEIKYLGPETLMEGKVSLKTEKLELVAKDPESKEHPQSHHLGRSGEWRQPEADLRCGLDPLPRQRVLQHQGQSALARRRFHPEDRQEDHIRQPVKFFILPNHQRSVPHPCDFFLLQGWDSFTYLQPFIAFYKIRTTHERTVPHRFRVFCAMDGIAPPIIAFYSFLQIRTAHECTVPHPFRVLCEMGGKPQRQAASPTYSFLSFHDQNPVIR